MQKRWLYDHRRRRISASTALTSNRYSRSTTKQTEIIRSLQVLRFIAAAMVIATHSTKTLRSISRGTNAEADFFLLQPILNAGDAGVDLFFVLSGFIMVWIAKDRWHQKQFPLRFIVRRGLRVYPIYWVFLVVGCLVVYAKSVASNSIYVGENLGLNWRWILESFFLVPLSKPDGAMGPVLGVGWTLIFEIFFYVCFALACCVKQVHPMVILGIVFSTLVLIGQQYEGESWWIITYTHPLILEFFAGGLIALVAFKKLFPLWLGLFLIIAGFLILASLSGALPGGKLTDSRIFGYGLPSAMIVFGFVTIEPHIGNRLPNWAVSLGDSSYSSYLSHTVLPLKIGALIVLKTSLLLWVPTVTLVAAFVLVSLAFGHVVFLYVERPLLRLAKNLIDRYDVWWSRFKMESSN